MKFTTILLALGTTAPAVLAAPAVHNNNNNNNNNAADRPADRPADRQPDRQPDLVDMWVDENFNGPKYTGPGNEGQCVNLPSNFNDKLSSGKARPGYRCTVWPDADCKTNKDNYSFDDQSSGANFPYWINDRGSSWRCVRA